jgi:hypothetical protein
LFERCPVKSAYVKHKISFMILELGLAQWLSWGDGELSIDVLALGKTIDDVLRKMLAADAKDRVEMQNFVVDILNNVRVDPETGELVEIDAEEDSGVSLGDRCVLFSYLHRAIEALPEAIAVVALEAANPTVASLGLPSVLDTAETTTTTSATGGKESKQFQFNELSLAINLFFWVLIVGLVRVPTEKGPVDARIYFLQLWAAFTPMREKTPPTARYMDNRRKNTNCVLCLGLLEPNPAAAWGLDGTYFRGWKLEKQPTNAVEVNLSGIVGHCSKHDLTDSKSNREYLGSITKKVKEAVAGTHAAEKKKVVQPEAQGDQPREGPAKTVTKTCSETAYIAALKRAVNHLVESCSGKEFLSDVVCDLVDGSQEEKKLLQQLFWLCFSMARSSMWQVFEQRGGLDVLRNTKPAKKGRTPHGEPLKALRKRMQPFHISPILANEFERKAAAKATLAAPAESSEEVSLVLDFAQKEFAVFWTQILQQWLEPLNGFFTVAEAPLAGGVPAVLVVQRPPPAQNEEQAAVEVEDANQEAVVVEEEGAEQPKIWTRSKSKLESQKRERDNTGNEPDNGKKPKEKRKKESKKKRK